MSQIPKSPFIIEPHEAESLRKSHHLPSLPLLLPHLLPAAQSLSRPSISRFPVGAAALGLSGRIYLGSNLEFPNSPLHHSIHAEQFAVSNALSHSEPSLPFLAISHPPCGHCRQFLQELPSSPHLQILLPNNKNTFLPLSHFLPIPFGPSDLLPDDIPRLLDPVFNDLVAVGGEGRGMRGGEEAVRAANTAYAPYSGSASGFAVVDEEGRVYAGAYVESCAYNPSLGPVQAAVVAHLVGGGGRIVEGVLAEREGAAVRQEEEARVLFEAVAPGARFGVVRLGKSG